MQLEFDEAERAFQREVREFLDEALTDDIRRAVAQTPTVFVEKDIAERWHAKLAERGWLAPLWPREYGGAGWNVTQQFIYEAEAARAGAPGTIPMGVRMVGPVIIRFGTEAQKRHYLPRILSGEDYWCQGYSEPGAGSDLASLKCRAEPDGDDYLVNGTKIWTTHAHCANRIFCLVRTSSKGRPQAGITFLLIDMETPGVSVRPIRSFSGDHEINQVFFDNVRVPQANRVGEEGQGWTCAKFLLEHERGGMAAHRMKAMLEQVRRIARAEGLGDDPLMQAKLAEVEIDILALEFSELRLLSDLSAGTPAGPESSVLKVQFTEIQQRLTELAVDAVGPGGLFFQPARPLYEADSGAAVPDYLPAVMPTYMNARAASIYAGTNEIQRNLIARLVLGA
jgi:acyl-CoA dehydrogenase